MENVLDHPLIKHKMTLLKDKNTGTKEFRELVSEVSIELVFEALKDAKLEDVEIETPLAKTTGKRLNEDNYAFVPILRAGTGMLDGVIKVMPNAKIGHVGLYRNVETLEPVEYYFKVPKCIEQREVIILEPIVATGGSIIAAVQMLKEAGAKSIKVLCLITTVESMKKVAEAHPDVKIYTASVEEELTDKGYVVPGLGDAGDRIFGTK
ncbi:MAG: uracil phosphoribosyltransferase [Oscillospiraceae bacterium]|nr:uracil phosphoribosyltransferase [Oscillospiraceae bacterium]